MIFLGWRNPELEMESGLNSDSLQMWNQSLWSRFVQRDRGPSAGWCTLQSQVQSQNLFIGGWLGCYMASSPVNPQDHITRGVKVSDNKQNVSQIHGGEPNGEPDCFGNPYRGHPINEKDLTGCDWSFQKMEARNEFGIYETELCTRIEQSFNWRGNGQRIDGETDRTLKRKGIRCLFGTIRVRAAGESCHTP